MSLKSILSFLLNGVLTILFVSFLFLTHPHGSPLKSYSLSKTLQPDVSRKLILLASNGQQFAERGGCVEAPVRLDEVPQHLVNALVATEDRRFYSHFGIDPIGLLRAVSQNHKAGRVVQGGSTITQQLAKISYLSSAKTLERKLEEALIAIWLELRFSKEQILEGYLSSAYFGGGCYGLRAAARHYFAKNIRDLTISESVHLVALLSSPSILRVHPEKLRLREKLVLRAMVEEGYLDDTDREMILPAWRLQIQKNQPGAHFADWIETNYQPIAGDPTAPLSVRTSLDLTLQKIAENAVRQVLAKDGRARNTAEAALVAMRTDGRILAMVGGRDYSLSQFNRATQALRQPGSAFKLFVYLAALRAGAQTDMKFPDEPMTIDDWSPENYNKKHRGLVPLRKAFSSSINTVAVQLSETVGRNEVIRAARDLGITTPLKSVPSIALGTSEVTLQELTAAYAAVAADAYPIKPWSMLATGPKIKPGANIPEGSGEWKFEVGEPMKQLLGATVKYGTGRAARLSIPSFGKTGTSQDYRDAWFIGFAGNLVVGVWVGNDDNSPMRRVTGGSLPARIWRLFMDKARRADQNFRLKPDRIKEFESKTKPVQTALNNEGLFDALLKPEVKPKSKVSYTSSSGGWGTKGKVPWDELIITD